MYDTIHTRHEGILYSQNVTHFYSTHIDVISVAPVGNVAPSLYQIFMKLKNAQQHYVQIICTDFQPNWTINFESTSRNSCKALSKVWLYLCQFS